MVCIYACNLRYGQAVVSSSISWKVSWQIACQHPLILWSTATQPTCWITLLALIVTKTFASRAHNLNVTLSARYIGRNVHICRCRQLSFEAFICRYRCRADIIVHPYLQNIDYPVELAATMEFLQRYLFNMHYTLDTKQTKTLSNHLSTSCLLELGLCGPTGRKNMPL